MGAGPLPVTGTAGRLFCVHTTDRSASEQPDPCPVGMSPEDPSQTERHTPGAPQIRGPRVVRLTDTKGGQRGLGWGSR